MNFQPDLPLDVVDRLFAVPYNADANDVAYVYRVERNGTLRRPYALKCHPAPELLEYVQRNLGDGHYRFIIRRGRTMVFSGEIAMEAPIAAVRERDLQPIVR